MAVLNFQVAHQLRRCDAFVLRLAFGASKEKPDDSLLTSFLS